LYNSVKNFNNHQKSSKMSTP